MHITIQLLTVGSPIVLIIRRIVGHTEDQIHTKSCHFLLVTLDAVSRFAPELHLRVLTLLSIRRVCSVDLIHYYMGTLSDLSGDGMLPSC